MASRIAVSFFILELAAKVYGEFNYTKCPAPWELQSDAVKQNFSLRVPTTS